MYLWLICLEDNSIMVRLYVCIEGMHVLLNIKLYMYGCTCVLLVNKFYNLLMDVCMD
jgi:hypothetical protein